MKTIQIMQHDDGRFMVGEIPAAGPETPAPGGMPPGGAPAEPGAESDLLTPDAGMGAQDDMAGMTPARNVDEALQIARSLLTSNPEAEASEESDFQAGYKEAGGMQEEGTPY